ncbi:hypothetical protein PGH47_43010 (plasmid) [Streptomyces sp. HUAS 31]|uniref:hypothetical protein n=1 Tax=Streptomyces sp. HUAS 31 TaxID=3020055 RepID=UPI002304E6AB|nr:hypothetical protein [Streptomyces sp. HUAS 31]WCE02518.1 hypothetical protein PGH47_43010 [Streptomyces sp. HUAS 31]
MSFARRPPRNPVGWDLFGEPYFSERAREPAGPPPLPTYTSETLPEHLHTPKQIRDRGLEPAGRPVGMLSWTPLGQYTPVKCPVWDIRKAVRPLDQGPGLEL